MSSMKYTTIYAIGIGVTLLLLPLQRASAQETPSAPPPAEIQVSVDLRDAPVRLALEQLFREAKVDFVIAPDVLGSVTMNLKDLPLEQVLKIICRSNTVPLTYTKEGKIYEVKVRKAVVNPVNPPDNSSSRSEPVLSSAYYEPIHLNFLHPQQLEGIIGPVIMLPDSAGLRSGGTGQNPGQGANNRGNGNNTNNGGGVGGNGRGSNFGFPSDNGGYGLLPGGLGSGGNSGNGGSGGRRKGG